MKYTKEYISELMEIIELLFSLDTRVLANKLTSKFFNKYELQKTGMTDTYCLFEHTYDALDYISIYLDRNMWDTITVDNTMGEYPFHFYNPYRTEIELSIEILEMAYKYLKNYLHEHYELKVTNSN